MKKSDYSNNNLLIELLKMGDEKAFIYVMDAYHQKLCVYANSLIRDVFAAEDIVQNVYIRLWEQRSNLKSNQLLKSFLYKSVYNEFIDQYRKNQSLTTLEKNYFEALNTTVLEEDSENFDQILTVINREIENLPPKCKAVFILSKKEGLTNLEIAEYLNLSIKTVESQITKAFSILRKTLKEKVNTFLFLLFPKIRR